MDWLPPHAPAHPPDGALPRVTRTHPPAPRRRVRALDPARPALRLVSIALLTALATLLAIGIGWAIAL